MKPMNISDAIQILRKHNISGASVLRITEGKVTEHELLEQILNVCDQFVAEREEYKRLLKLAVEDLNFNTVCLNFDTCKVCAKRYGISCEEKFKWCYTDEALKLIGGG